MHYFSMFKIKIILHFNILCFFLNFSYDYNIYFFINKYIYIYLVLIF